MHGNWTMNNVLTFMYRKIKKDKSVYIGTVNIPF